MGRGLRELGIGWIGAYSPQAKGRIERSFRTAQDRLVKDLRLAGVESALRAPDRGLPQSASSHDASARFNRSGGPAPIDEYCIVLIYSAHDNTTH
jgi:hypothetical protein